MIFLVAPKRLTEHISDDSVDSSAALSLIRETAPPQHAG
jgi:hypothetical protein